MFSLFHKKKPISECLTGFTDHHSHILPGVDDGVKKMETSLKVLAHYETLGISEVWCTPHIMEDVPNTTEGLQARFAELQDAYEGSIVLHLAAEYMMDALFEERLEHDDLLLMSGDDCEQLLVETSYFTAPMDIQGTLRQIKSKGYYPILAHPERYVYMEPDMYDKLKNMDIRFQLNLSSIGGAYGPHVAKKALYLLKKGYYDMAGSDLHSMRNIEFWAAPASKEFISLLNK